MMGCYAQTGGGGKLETNTAPERKESIWYPGGERSLTSYIYRERGKKGKTFSTSFSRIPIVPVSTRERRRKRGATKLQRCERKGGESEASYVVPRSNPLISCTSEGKTPVYE